ncbi:rhodanese-like domain-containing protein 11, chloroplastic isoform X2 [Gossypium australe]|uniref:Rhodanese-like domain-containing protein 11, chloroplastic isoform X2 n=1 Tax=Gossypium australe TaxID=47621 RepID=A0A5B6V2D4_9ROSI|nr:rhodanese-like domain-containing protein 11, chloroplastic isoform X2 [Gossypium australe]
MVRPTVSVMSKSISFAPPGNDQSNLCTRFAKRSSFIAIANKIPGQILLPELNGISSKCCPLKSMELSKNLSGRNSSGFSHNAGEANCVFPLNLQQNIHKVFWIFTLGPCMIIYVPVMPIHMFFEHSIQKFIKLLRHFLGFTMESINIA